MNNSVNVNMTIGEARDLMRPLLKKGVKCYCCGLRAQLYKRNLTSSMIYGLIMLYKESARLYKSDGWAPLIHIESFFKNAAVSSSMRADIAKLKLWGFLAAHTGEKEDGNPHNGLYWVTDKGSQFVLGKILVQKSVKIYNNTFMGFDGAEIDIWGAIKNKFNYNEIMNKK